MQVHLDDNRTVTADTMQHFRENFRLLDTDKDGKLNKQETGILFRAFGQNPTDEDLNAMLDAIPTLIDFDDFVAFFKKNYKTPTSEEVLIQAFQVFDVADKGVLNIDKFKDVMASLGEPLPTHEITEIMNEIKTDAQGNFDYVSLAKQLCQGPKGLPTN